MGRGVTTMALAGRMREFYQGSRMRLGVSAWYPYDADLVVIDPPRLNAETLKDYRVQLGAHGRALVAWRSEERAELVRAEFTQSALEAGFASEALAWYYPRPDHWFTGEVFSDVCSPRSASLRFPALPLPGSSYLVELRADVCDTPCGVECATVSAYRDPSHRFATTIDADGLVRKRALGSGAQVGLRQLVDNHKELASLGLNVVPMCVDGTTVVMPRYTLPTLMDYVVGLLDGSAQEEAPVIAAVAMAVDSASCTPGAPSESNESSVPSVPSPPRELEAEVICLFDQLHEDIHRAAVRGTCYWELVPANCFYDKKTDSFIYFDQEFSTVGVPSDVAVARGVLALRHAPALEGNGRSLALSERLIERYGLRSEHDMIKAYYDFETTRHVQGDEFMRYLQLVREVTNAS